MPVMTVDRVQKREAALRKSLDDKGDSMEAGRRRSVKKRIRRAQRKRRRLLTEAARIAPKPAKDAAEATEAAPAEAAKSE